MAGQAAAKAGKEAMSIGSRRSVGDRYAIDDLAIAGSCHRWYLVRVLIGARAVGGVASLPGLVVAHGLVPAVTVLLVLWFVVFLPHALLLMTVRRRHLPRRRHVTAALSLDSLLAVALNVAAVLLVPGSVQDGHGDVFWFYAVTSVAGWWALQGPRMGVVALTTGTVVAWGLVAVDPDRTYPVDLAGEIGVVVLHGAWLAAGVFALLMADRLIRLVTWVAFSDGLEVGRRTAQVQVQRDLHDTVLQTMDSLALRASAPRRDPARELRDLAEVARSQAQELRDYLQQPPGIEDPMAVVGDLRARFARELEIEFEVVDAARTVRMPAEVAMAVQGAVRECLTNVVKHAGTRRALIEVDGSSQELRVTVRDDGCGFSVVDTPLRFGLARSVIQRIEEVGGTVTLSSRLGHGTAVALAVPLHRGSVAGAGIARLASGRPPPPRIPGYVLTPAIVGADCVVADSSS
jgi:signal transduction histidine kinase